MPTSSCDRGTDASRRGPTPRQAETAEGGVVTQPNPVTDDQTVTVRVPITIRQRGGRKLVLAPDGRTVIAASVCRRIDSAMIKAIARAFRWRDMLENGTYCTVREIAAAEKINETYIGRVLG